jgi:hypothetical protein
MVLLFQPGVSDEQKCELYLKVGPTLCRRGPAHQLCLRGLRTGPIRSGSSCPVSAGADR